MLTTIQLLVLFLPWVLASYLNVVVWRKSWRKSAVGHSRCDHCNLPLRAWELIPIIGFLLVGGRCPTCRARLSWEHPIFETLFIVGWYLLIWAFGFNYVWLTPLLILYVYGYLLSVYDLRYRLVPRNEILLGTALIAAWQIWQQGWVSLWPAGLILLLVVSSVLVTSYFTKKPIGSLIGLADWWVVVQIALLVGIPESWWIIVMASVVSLLLSPLPYFGKKIPYVAMLYFSTLVVVIGQQLSWLPIN